MGRTGKNKIGDGSGVAKLMSAKRPVLEMIDELYLTAFSRKPTSVELNRTKEYIESATDKQKALEDVLWAMLNSKEFMFNH